MGAVQVCRCCADSHSHDHMISGLPVQSNESPSDLCHSVHLPVVFSLFPSDSFHPVLPVQCVAHCVDRTLHETLLLQLFSVSDSVSPGCRVKVVDWLKQMSCVTLRGRHTQRSHTLSNVSSSLRSAAVSGHQVQWSPVEPASALH